MQKLIFSLLVAAAAIGIFGRSTRSDFIWNDKQVALNEQGKPATFGKRLASEFQLKHHDVYTPIPNLAWATLDRVADHFDKPKSVVFHTANVATHAANAVLVFLILALVLQNAPAGFFGALLFALHPLQVEAVAYVSALAFPLGAFFAFIAIWQYLLYSYAREQQSRGKKDPIRHYYAASVGFVLAILSVPSLVVLPLIAMTLDKLLPRRSTFMAPRKPAWPLGLWFVASLPQIGWTISTQNTAALSAELPFWIKPVVAADALSFYLSKLFAPAFIGPDYGRSPAFIASHWWGFVTWVLPFTLFLILLYWREKARSWYASAFGIFALALLPFLGFIFFEAQGSSTIANRYAYFAMLGPALGIAYAMTTPKKAWLQLAGFAAIIACGYLSVSRLKNWRDDNALWSYAVQVNPGSPIAHEVLGNDYRAKGDWLQAREHYQKVLEINTTSADIHFYLAEIERLHGDPEKAADLYRQVLKLDPRFAKAYGSLGLVLLKKEEFEPALQNFRKAVELEPENQEALKNLGLLYVKKKEFAEAVPLLQRALSVGEAAAGDGSSPSDQAMVHALLGLALVNTNQGDQAREHLETALKLDPNHSEAHRTLADIYFGQEQYDKALPHYQKAVEQPDASPEAFNNLGIILAMHKSNEKAAASFSKALALKPDWPSAMTNLGVAEYQLRHFAEAQKAFLRTLELKPAQADPYYYLGDMMRWQGKEKEALGYYYHAIKINPNHVDANYRLGNYYLKASNPQQAIRHYQAGLKVAPEDGRLLFSLKKAQGQAGISDAAKM